MTISEEDLRALFRPKKDTTPVVADVDMEGLRKTAHMAPCARHDLKCGECGALMILRRTGKWGIFYGCSRFPDCKGAHGAWPDGRPKGVPANRKTNAARIRAHKVFDRIWQQKHLTRKQAYAWMSKVMKLPSDEAHISRFTLEQCDLLMKLVRERFPGVRSLWEKLRENTYDAADYRL